MLPDHPVINSLQASHGAPSVDLEGVEFSRLHEYYGAWAVDHGRFWAAFNRVKQIDLAGHVAAARAPRASAAVTVVSGPSAAEMVDSSGDSSATRVAVIQIRGTMMKQASSLEESTSTVRARRAIRQATNDPSIGGILLVIDSPGGTVSGTSDLAAEVRNAAASKPTYAFVEDFAASAAYWVASQAEKVFANDRTALVGSIGTLLVLVDASEWASGQGLEVLVFKTGELKGAGVPGAPVSDRAKAYFQRIVDRMQASFSAGVAAGRKLKVEQVEKVATGEVFLADEALGHKLIDGIQSFDATLRQLFQAASRSRNQGRTQETTAMADNQTPTADATPVPQAEAQAEAQAQAPEATSASAANANSAPVAEQPAQPAAKESGATESTSATFAELKQAFPKASAEFREQCQEKGLNLAQAGAAYASHLEEQLDEERQASTDLRQRLGNTDRGGDEAVEFEAEAGPDVARRQQMARHMGAGAAALGSVIRLGGTGRGS